MSTKINIRLDDLYGPASFGGGGGGGGGGGWGKVARDAVHVAGDAAGAAAAIASIPEDGPIGGVIAAGVVNDGISASHQLVHDWNHRND